MQTDTATGIGRFIEDFRNEHREARDILFGMQQAFRDRDPARFAELMNAMNADLGMHMRYEEEAMYPALEDLFGPRYVEDMLQDHDRMLGVAGRLGELAGHDPITDEDVEEAVRLLQGQLPHVTDCDGLAIVIETLPEDKQRAILEARDRAAADRLTVMGWAERRGRAPIPPG
jgi:hypothetical protein